MKLAIAGLSQVGKKNIFELLCGIPFDKAPRRSGLAYGIAPVRDPRVDELVRMYEPRRTRYAEFEIVFIPALEPGGARGGEWLEALRTADGIIQVVRAFDNPSVFHAAGSIDPARDLETVGMELLLADLAMVETRLERLRKLPRDKTAPGHDREVQLLQRCREHLEAEQSLRTLETAEDERLILRTLQMLTLKPMVAVFNTGEDLRAATADLAPLVARLEEQGGTAVLLSAPIEKDISELEPAERREFMADLGISEPAAHRLSRAAYTALGLISFFTVGKDEVRAWSIRRGTVAAEAAGKIHTDLQRGFIRAETVAYDDLIRAGSEKQAHEANCYRLNGKEYVVQDGDIMNIRFNV